MPEVPISFRVASLALVYSYDCCIAWAAIFNQAWVTNRISSKKWDEIIYPFSNFNGCTVEVWEWISNFITHFIMDVIIDTCWDLSYTMLVKGTLGCTVGCRIFRHEKVKHVMRTWINVKIKSKTATWVMTFVALFARLFQTGKRKSM